MHASKKGLAHNLGGEFSGRPNFLFELTVTH